VQTHSTVSVCNCGKEIYTQKKYCSRECFYKFRKRPSELNYNIVAVNKGWFKFRGGFITPKGYRRIWVKGKLVYEHKYILENKIGRKLTSEEVTHHINGDKLDNRPDNLTIMPKREHDIFHWQMTRRLA